MKNINRDAPGIPTTVKTALGQGYTHNATYIRHRMLRTNDLMESGMWELSHKTQGTLLVPFSCKTNFGQPQSAERKKPVRTYDSRSKSEQTRRAKG